jgi:UPF0176 protein
MSERITNIAAYLFVTIEDVDAVHVHLQGLAIAQALKGTILVAPEGLNLFLAGTPSAIDDFLAAVHHDARFAGLTPKYSFSDRQPFGKLLVKKKREIVPLGEHNVDLNHVSAPRIDAPTLKAWIDEGRDIVLLDTRNRFEFDMGAFEGAAELGLTQFRDFPAAVAKMLPAWRDKTIVTFCTGGIRCEKAAPLMRQQGFTDVYQLDGGILKYFESVGQDHYRGTCFVFDDRRAVDAALQPAPPTPIAA